MRIFGGKKKQNNRAISLDIGTEYVKCLVFEVIDGVAVVRGVGRQRQKLSDMHGGGVTDIHGVAQNCEKAINAAANQAQFLPDQVIIGIAGELVKGITTSVKLVRKTPTSKIDISELQKIVNDAQAEAFKRAREELIAETGQDGIDVELVNAAIVSVSIDGYKVSNPMSYQGKTLSVQVYNSFAPIVQLGAIRAVADELGLSLLAVAAEPYAVARCLDENSTDFAAIFIDIGGGTTDVAVVRNGGVEGTKMFAIGGRAFTKRVGSALGESFVQAEEAKIAYAKKTLEPEKAKLVEHALSMDSRVWLSALELSLEEFGEADLLPSKILLCGGGSNLPEIKKVLEDKTWYKSLPFAKQPDVQFINPDEVVRTKDATNSLTDVSEVTPLALASVAIELVDDPGILNTMMRQAIQGLKQ